MKFNFLKESRMAVHHSKGRRSEPLVYLLKKQHKKTPNPGYVTLCDIPEPNIVYTYGTTYGSIHFANPDHSFGGGDSFQ